MNKIYISHLADNRIKEYVTTLGYRVCEVTALAQIDAPIACHPDVYMCALGGKVFHGDPSVLTHDYPGHAVYNGCCTGKHFIHNTKITDKNLLAAVKESGMQTVHVAQGYAKCSCVVVDEDSIITADHGIAKAATSCGMQVLVVEKGQVHLDGYPYGFIGGASGKVGNAILFNGDLSKHSDFDAICRFIEERGLAVKYFEDYPLTDIGSIIEEMED